MRERAVFIGSISVWDTIGTLPPLAFEIVGLFSPVYCRVMGRKAPRKRLACRDTARPTGARWHPNVSRRSAAVSAKLMNSPDNYRRCAAITGCCRVCRTGVVTPTRRAADAEQLIHLVYEPFADRHRWTIVGPL